MTTFGIPTVPPEIGTLYDSEGLEWERVSRRSDGHAVWVSGVKGWDVIEIIEPDLIYNYGPMTTEPEGEDHGNP